MKNIKIAIIDDKESDASFLKSFIDKYQESHKDNYCFQIINFDRGINFIDPFDGSFDIVFLDIDMPIMSGLETAKKIREFKSRMNIIFVTNYASLAVDGYGVDALGFIVKPVKENDVYFVLDKALDKIERESSDEKVIIKIKSGYQTIKTSSIKYIEVNVHDIFYHTLDGTFKTRGVLKQIEETFDKKKFVKASSCYLVNLDFIDSIEGDDIKIDGTRLKIARTRKKEFIEAFLANYQ